MNIIKRKYNVTLIVPVEVEWQPSDDLINLPLDHPEICELLTQEAVDTIRELDDWGDIAPLFKNAEMVEEINS